MAIYYWLPVSDGDYDGYVRSRVTKVSGHMLPYTDGSYPGSERNAQWNALKANDEINICAHGIATNMNKVGWASAAGVEKWTAARLAAELALRLETYGRINFPYNIHLRACWGANSMLKIWPSFGKQLAKELKLAGVKGKLTAYRGSFLIDAYGDHTQGSSRFTSGMLAGKTVARHNVSLLASNKTRNRFGVRAAFDLDSQSEEWLLA